MDLSTVRKNLDKYQHFEEVFSDLQLIWNNCKTYNQSGSEIYRLAENMERRCKKLIRDLRNNLKLDSAAGGSAPRNQEGDGSAPDMIDTHARESLLEEGGAENNKKPSTEDEDDDDDFGYDPQRYVPFDEKVEFADGIKRVTKEGLTQIVNYLKEK